MAVQLTMSAWLALEVVEEAVLTEVIGRPYADYAAHTKRLVPLLW